MPIPSLMLAKVLETLKFSKNNMKIEIFQEQHENPSSWKNVYPDQQRCFCIYHTPDDVVPIYGFIL